MSRLLSVRSALYGMVLTASIALNGATSAIAAGSHDGIEVLTPANFNTPGAVHQSWHVLGSRPTIELFINQPRHNQPAGTYDLRNFPLQYRVQYGVCNNAPSAARVIGRFDQTGGVCRTSFDANANWVTVHNQTYNNQSPIGGTDAGGYWLSEGSFNGNVNISGVNPSADKTTFQLYATWAPDAGHFGVYDEAHFIQYRRIHAVNFCINIPSKGPVCGNGKVETGEECDDGNTNNNDACTNQCKNNSTDIKLEKIVHNPSQTKKGTRVTFILRATNISGVHAAGVKIVDTIPTGLTFDPNPQQSSQHCTVISGQVTCDLGSLPAGASRDSVVSFLIPVTYQPGVCPGSVTNVAAIYTTTHEPNKANNTATAVASVACPTPVCGNSKVEAGEQCDDGNTNNNDSCTNQCQAARCGDGIVRTGVEQCDDGNTNSNDACSNSCTVNQQGRPNLQIQKVVAATSVRGQNVVYTFTAKNMGTAVATNVYVYDAYYASANPVTRIASPVTYVSSSVPCSFSALGDPKLLGCSVGNLNPGEMKTFTVTFLVPNTVQCGTTLYNTADIAESGKGSVDWDSAQTTVQCPASCGDGKVDAGEQCDDGNSTNNDGCTNACQLPRCGDGILHSGEQCDDGNTNNNDSCNNSCQVVTQPVCGNGIVEAGEQCDDGNTNNNDACSNSCQINQVSGCIDILKEAFDPNGNRLQTVPQFTFRVDNNQSVVNNSAGFVRISGITPGNHTVTEVLPQGWEQILVTPSNGQVQVVAGNNCAAVGFKNRQVQQSSSTPSFTITKTDHESEVEPGDELEYEIRVRNNSNQTVHNVRIVDELPSDVEFDDCSNNCDEDDGDVEWDDLTFGPFEERTFWIEVTVDDDAEDGDEIRNEVTLRQSQYGIVLTAIDRTDIEKGKKRKNDDVEVEITKRASTSEVFPGGIIEYTVTIENTGDEDIKDLTLEDVLPSGVTILDDGDADKRSGNARLQWEFDLDEGDDWTIRYTVATNLNLFPGTLLVNKACVTDDDDEVDECASTTVYVIGELPQTGNGSQNRYGSQYLKPISSQNSSSAGAAVAWISIVTTLAGAGVGVYRKFFI